MRRRTKSNPHTRKHKSHKRNSSTAHTDSDQTAVDPAIATYLDWEDELKLTEHLTHILPYELAYKGLIPIEVPRLNTEGIDGIVGDKQITDEDGIPRKYYIKKVKTAAGLNCFILFSSHADNPRIRVLFRGTKDIEAWARNVENLGSDPGGDSFKLYEQEIIKSVRQVVTYKAKQGCRQIQMEAAGHSLGGADTQRFSASLLKYMAENPADKAMGKVSALTIRHANSAGISKNTQEAAEQSIDTLYSQRVVTGSTPLKVKQYIIHVGGDPVQTSGEAALFANAAPDKVHTVLFRCDLKDNRINTINPHSAYFAGKADKVGTEFTFRVYDNQDATQRSHVYDMLNFKTHNLLNIKNKALQALNILRFYREQSQPIKHFVNNIDLIIPYAQYATYTFIEDQQFGDLINYFDEISYEYIQNLKEHLHTLTANLDAASEIIPYIDSFQENAQFIARIVSCLHSYIEYKDKLTPIEKKACQIGLAMIAFAGALSMAPILAPGAIPASLAVTLSSVCAGLVKEGCYLCKMGLYRHKDLKAESQLFELLHEYARSLTEHEQSNIFTIGLKEHTKRMMQYGFAHKIQRFKEITSKLSDALEEIKDILYAYRAANISTYEFISLITAEANTILKTVQEIANEGNNPVAATFISSARTLLDLVHNANPLRLKDGLESFINSAYSALAGQVEIAEEHMPQSNLEDVAEPFYDALDVVEMDLRQQTPVEKVENTIPGLVTIMAGLSAMMVDTDHQLEDTSKEIIAVGKDLFEHTRQPDQDYGAGISC